MNKTFIVCLSTLLLLSACEEFDNEPPDFANLRESRPLGSTKELRVTLEYDVGKLEISKAQRSDLFSLDLDYDQRRSRPEFEFNEGERATMRLDIDSARRGFGNTRRSNDLTLELNDSIPLDLDIRTGVADAHLDLTDLDIRRLHLRGGVGRTDVAFDRPATLPLNSLEVESGVGDLAIRGLGNARVERLEVKGGVGRTELDYTGEIGSTATESTIKVGVGQIRLVLPRDADIEIQGQGSFLSNISTPSSFEHRGRTYTHRGADSTSPKIQIRVESGVGGVTVELI